MRPFNAALQEALERRYGVEPNVILEVQWGGNITDSAIYVDSEMTDLVYNGLIDTISPIGDSVELSNVTSNQQIEVALLDADEHLKNIFFSRSVKNVIVRVYLHDASLTTNNFRDNIIFAGVVDTPVTYTQSTKRLSFTATTALESSETGFSVEEGNFANPNQELVGKPWPLCFGTVKNVPALDLTAYTTGTLSESTGIEDPLLTTKLEKALKIICPTQARLVAGGGFALEGTGVISRQQTSDCQRARCEALDGTANAIKTQAEFVKKQFRVAGGDRFPQGQDITLLIEGGHFHGQFLGSADAPSEIFRVKSTTHPDLVPFSGSVQAYLASRISDQSTRLTRCGGARITAERQAFIDQYGIDPETPGGILRMMPADQTEAVDVQTALVNYRSRASFDAYNDVPSLDFLLAPSGSKVTMLRTDGAIYVASLVPATVLYVKAYRKDPFSGRRVFVQVPQSLWYTRLAAYGSYNITEIVFDRKLSTIRENNKSAGWEDDIYVTLQSTVGPNTIDILRWFIATYTPYTTDTTFDVTRPKLIPFPMNFATFDRKDVKTVIAEIAFQARCAVVLNGTTYSITYLPEEPTFVTAGIANYAIPVASANKIEAQSFQLSYSELSQLVTKMVIEWKDRYDLTEPNKVIIRYNIKPHGLREKTYDFYCFTDRDLVKHAATFWMVRFANIWLVASFKTHLDFARMQALDPLVLSYTQFMPVDNITGRVLSQSVDTSEATVSFTLWLPILAGTAEIYRFAHPANLGIEDYWPTQSELDLGLAGPGSTLGSNVSTSESLAPLEPPKDYNVTNIPLTCESAQHSETRQRLKCDEDEGRRDITDKEKQAPDPTVEVEDETDYETVSKSEEWRREQLDKQTALNEEIERLREDAGLDKTEETALNENSPTGSGGETDDEGNPLDPEPDRTPEPFDDPVGECYYFTRNYYGIVDIVKGENGPVSSFGTFGEVLVYTSTRTTERRFTSLSAIQTYVASVQAATQPPFGAVGIEALVNNDGISRTACDPPNEEPA